MRTLLSLAVLAVLAAQQSLAQVPVHEDPAAPAPQTTSEPLRGMAAWNGLQRVVGGEWHADEHFYKKSFRIFREGPGGTSLIVENRDKDDLGAPLAGLSVLFYDPGKDAVRGLGVGSNGSFYSSEIHWQGEMMVNEQTYHIADGTQIEGQMVERSMDLVERWSFEANQAFRWELFQKTPEGITPLLETVFVHHNDLTELPPPRADESKPLGPWRFLGGLEGTHSDTKDGWQLAGTWKAGCRAMWVERSMPNPFGDKPMQVSGFFYYDPLEKGFRFLGFSGRGDLIQGKTQQNEARQIETAYEITPVATDNEEQASERAFGRLGETISVLDGGALSTSWILMAPSGQPKVIEASLKRS